MPSNFNIPLQKINNHFYQPWLLYTIFAVVFISPVLFNTVRSIEGLLFYDLDLCDSFDQSIETGIYLKKNIQGKIDYLHRSKNDKNQSLSCEGLFIDTDSNYYKVSFNVFFSRSSNYYFAEVEINVLPENLFYTYLSPSIVDMILKDYGSINRFLKKFEEELKKELEKNIKKQEERLNKQEEIKILKNTLDTNYKQ